LSDHLPEDAITAICQAQSSFLKQQNFNSAVNYSVLLASIRLLTEKSSAQATIDISDQVLKWLCTTHGAVNQQSFLKKNPSLNDIQNHLYLIQTYLFHDQIKLTKNQETTLIGRLLEYATSEVYTYRIAPFKQAVDVVASKANQNQIVQLLTALLNK
jgi:hypothetical protein